jgi:hypothetical protein
MERESQGLSFRHDALRGIRRQYYWRWFVALIFVVIAAAAYKHSRLLLETMQESHESRIALLWVFAVPVLLSCAVGSLCANFKAWLSYGLIIVLVCCGYFVFCVLMLHVQ